MHQQKQDQHHLLPYDRITGLSPTAWLCVGAGFSREDVKTLILDQGYGFVADAVCTLSEICLKITGKASDRVLNPAARQEVIRELLSEPRIIADLNEIKRIKRQRNFAKRIDQALQAGRLAYAHTEEEEVYEERLANGHSSTSTLRSELRAFSKAYEAWLTVSGFLDLPLLMREATQVLREQGWLPMNLPEEILVLSGEPPESLERDFWETLSQNMKKPIRVRHLQTLVEPPSDQTVPLPHWQQWHTLDDAAEFLADELCKTENLESLKDHGILIPDIPKIRRSLNRALKERGLPLADSRDPTRLRWEEPVKWALLPLEVVARNFERQKVITWLLTHQMQTETPAWVSEIHNRGIRNGLGSYAGGTLSGVHSRLQELAEQFGKKKICKELSEIHLNYIRSNLGSYVDPESSAILPESEPSPSAPLNQESSWVITFFEATWKSLCTDFERIGQAERQAHLLFWLERLQNRVFEASPPIDKVKAKSGVQIYRLQQAPVSPVKKIWVFGLPSYWLRGEGLGNDWFSERDREILATEFSVRSSVQLREERLAILTAWLTTAHEVIILDFAYHPDGRENESLLPILKEIEKASGLQFRNAPVDCGSHPRYRSSYRALRPVQPQLIPLPKQPSRPKAPELTATLIDHFSRCSFLAMAYHRWNLKDLREPDIELWPEVKGKILHEAVRILASSLDAQAEFTVRSEKALDDAWKRFRPKGLIRNPRIEKYLKARLVRVLDLFCEKEGEYIKKSGTRPYHIEDLDLRIDYPEFSIVGKPDRVDHHPDGGLFVIDFKTSGSVPHGSDMIEKGYRLQLPFYAIAIEKQLKEPVLGVQFVELNSTGSRRNGIFFKEFNGKEQGKLTQVRQNSKSLISRPLADVWQSLEKTLFETASKYVNGEFSAKPNMTPRSKECSGCRIGDLCGFKRLVEDPPIQNAASGSAAGVSDVGE